MLQALLILGCVSHSLKCTSLRLVLIIADTVAVLQDDMVKYTGDKGGVIDPVIS